MNGHYLSRKGHNSMVPSSMPQSKAFTDGGVSTDDPGFVMVPYGMLHQASGDAIKLYGIVLWLQHIGIPASPALLGRWLPSERVPSLIAELRKLGALEVEL